ncbi:LysR family transcriptional regulator [Dyella ginsengisoli]|uniref:LysR family transcriptional regulator n=1 Tax=Dyella ginsengisoli TaxID=363848 RepID=A0ABW8JTH8_9GAMM
MSQLDDMRLFVTTLDTGSFTAAADRLGLSKQFISRRVMALEAQLGVRLLVRTTRHLRATDLGRTYAEQARRILQQVEELDQAISGAGQAPRGRLRLTAPMSFGTMHLSPLLARFLADYPQVGIELDLGDRMVDLLGEGYDLAIRIGVLADSSLIARSIAPVETVVCCSPDYLARHPAPATPADLATHECLLYGHGPHVEWKFGGAAAPAVTVRGRFRANNGELMRDAAIRGLGIARLPTFIVGEALAAGTLVTLLDDYRPAATAVHAVYPQHRQSSLLIHTFVDFLARELALPPHLAPQPSARGARRGPHLR